MVGLVVACLPPAWPTLLDVADCLLPDRVKGTCPRIRAGVIWPGEPVLVQRRWGGRCGSDSKGSPAVCKGCPACWAALRCRYLGVALTPPVVFGTEPATSRLCTVSTRLETRTKESNMYASRGAIRSNPQGVAKAKVCPCGGLREDPCSGFHCAAHSRGVLDWAAFRRGPGGRTLSIHVGTRKMVTYARPRRSQGKLWWRSVAFLTCKSIV
jgi:hypothetical protein